MSNEPVTTIYCDTVASVAIHNGNGRIVFARLDKDAKAVPVLELILPIGAAIDLSTAAGTMRSNAPR